MKTLVTSSLTKSLRGIVVVPCLWLSLFTAPEATAQVNTDTLTTAQKADTTVAGVPVATLDPALQKGALRKRIIAPAIFIGAGLLMIDNGLYDRHDVRYDLRTKLFPNFKSDVDDFLIFAPTVGLVALDIFSSQNQHNVTRQAGLLVASAALGSVMLWPLKQATNVPRPNGENDYSFPSGHTTYAFVIATMVSREFKGKSKWIGIASYTAAGATGMMRVLNDAHWFSDVLAGAGVGILSTNLVYLAHDRWFKNKGLNKDWKAQVGPTMMFNGSPGVGMVIHLN